MIHSGRIRSNFVFKPIRQSVSAKMNWVRPDYWEHPFL